MRALEGGEGVGGEEEVVATMMELAEALVEALEEATGVALVEAEVAGEEAMVHMEEEEEGLVETWMVDMEDLEEEVEADLVEEEVGLAEEALVVEWIKGLVEALMEAMAMVVELEDSSLTQKVERMERAPR